MARHILRCPKCKKYTMKEECEQCKVRTVQVKPPKFSPEDPYGGYRREARKNNLKQKGLL